jgi:hypothetical protein
LDADAEVAPDARADGVAGPGAVAADPGTDVDPASADELALEPSATQ